MDFIKFIIDAGSWSIQHGSHWSLAILFTLMILVAYLAHSVVSMSLVPTNRYIVMAVTVSASVAFVIVSWGYIDSYTIYIKGCDAIGPYQRWCVSLP